MKETTPYPKAYCLDENIVYKGLLLEWDEEHNFTYFIAKELAESKYQHLIDDTTLMEWDKEEFMEEIEKYEDEPEQYQQMLKQIPWRKNHYEFNFSWGWCFDEVKDSYCIPVDSDAVIVWAGLDKQDLIFDVPINL